MHAATRAVRTRLHATATPADGGASHRQCEHRTRATGDSRSHTHTARALTDTCSHAIASDPRPGRGSVVICMRARPLGIYQQGQANQAPLRGCVYVYIYVSLYLYIYIMYQSRYVQLLIAASEYKTRSIDKLGLNRSNLTHP